MNNKILIDQYHLKENVVVPKFKVWILKDQQLKKSLSMQNKKIKEFWIWLKLIMIGHFLTIKSRIYKNLKVLRYYNTSSRKKNLFKNYINFKIKKRIDFELNKK